jgi:uncharacterized protein (DUF924 family)
MLPNDPSKTEALEPPWVCEVLHFWFEELADSNWFEKSDDLDALIRNRFLAVHELLMVDGGRGASTPRAMLAAVLVLDQFSRNAFRGDARAFAADPIARRISRSAIEQGFDAAMTKDERLFLYLPFEHSEDAADQALALDLIKPLGRDDLTRYAMAHKEIIDRFGRFPHRNEVLGRRSTAEEIEFLRGPMSSF